MVVEGSAPPNENVAAAQSRGDAIVEMVRAFDPRDSMETMFACHCVMLQFLLHNAMCDASNTRLEPAVLAKTRAGAISVSRTLHQWVTKFEKVRKRNEVHAAEAAQIQSAPVATAAKSAAQTSPDAVATPMRQPVPTSADPAATRAPRTNGQAPAAVTPLAAPLGTPSPVTALDAMRSAVAAAAKAQDHAPAIAGAIGGDGAGRSAAGLSP
jgi:hypothetical protein